MRFATPRPSVLSALTVAATVATLLAVSPEKAHAQASQAGPATLTPELESVRAGLDKYRDPIAAVHDGYLSTLGCIEYPEGGSEGTMQYAAGGMGVHFINLGHISPKLDVTKPQVLIYEPVGDKLQLVAAEWFVPLPMATAERPKIFGKDLQGPMEGHKPLMPEGTHHFDLHVWLWKSNPAGVFSPTNATVTCPKSAYSFAEAAPKLVPHKH